MGLAQISLLVPPPEFEDLLTLQLCMKPKFNDSKCVISKQGFTQSNLPDQIRNETSIPMHMTKQQPFLEAQISIINCKFYLKQPLDAKPDWKHIKVMITYNMIGMNIIVLQPSMV
jgi:hypothetical protein